MFDNTLDTIYTLSRKWTRTNENTYPNADALVDTNLSYQDIQRFLARNRIEVGGIISKVTVTEGIPDYAIDNDTYQIAFVEITYDADITDETKWKRLEKVDFVNLPSEWYNFLNNTSASNPKFDLFGGRVIVGPKPTATVAQAMRMWRIKRQDPFVGTSPSSEVAPWPFNLYPDAFAYRNAYRFWLPKNEAETAKYLKLYEGELQDMLADLRHETLEPIRTTPVDSFNAGWM